MNFYKCVLKSEKDGNDYVGYTGARLQREPNTLPCASAQGKRKVAKVGFSPSKSAKARLGVASKYPAQKDGVIKRPRSGLGQAGARLQRVSH